MKAPPWADVVWPVVPGRTIWHAQRTAAALRVLVGGLGANEDLFRPEVPDGTVMQAWSVMARTQHFFLVSTRHPARMREWLARWVDVDEASSEPQLVRGPPATRAAHPSGRGQLFAAMLEQMGAPPPDAAFPTYDWAEGMRWWPRQVGNIWLGVTVPGSLAGMASALAALRECPAAKRFVCIESLEEPLVGLDLDELDWVILEHAPRAQVDLVRGVRNRCVEAGVPFFFGGFSSVKGRKPLHQELDGRTWEQVP